MQDEELDKIINDAANQHHPAYDDAAWGKMLTLLDKHLPQKKDRRKPFAFWLLFLLLGGAVTTAVIMQPWNNKSAANKPVSSNENKTITTGSNTAEKNSSNTANETVVNTEKNKATVIQPEKNITGNQPNAVSNNNVIPNNSVSSNNTPAVLTASVNKIIKNKSRTAVKIKSPVAGNDNYSDDNNISGKKVAGKTKATIKAPASFEDEEKNIIEEAVVTTKPDSNAAISKQTDSTTTKINVPVNDTASKQTTTAVIPPAKKQSSNKGFKNNLAFTFSAGADKSFIETTNPGKTKFMYGVGAAYTFAKRFTASAGFYASKKVYDATPSQYKFPAGTWYPYLLQINANCLMYEIPVNIYYNFAPAKKHSWFAGGGISSIIMKEEYYNYKSKTPTGQYYNYEHSYSNENKHFFSAVTLSGGYRYRLSNRIQFMAEPYVKLPLSGIGAGAIKLKSGGILFTAAIKPFAKK